MTTAEFVAELQSRGFTFDQPVLLRYINWGGRHVARQTRPYWEQFTWNLTVNPGDAPVALSTMAGLKSVDKVIGTTDNFRRALSPLDDDRFLDRYLPLDLTAAANRNEPSSYYIWQSQLYILPPPVTARTFVVHGRRRWVDLDLSVPTGTPVTPTDYDEAIVLAALMRCHQRSNEWDIVESLRGDLEEALVAMTDEDELLMDEQQERTEPDNRWQ